MTQTTFTDNVVIDGSQDTEQLRVQGHTTQNDPLQTWENSAAGVLAQVTGDGRLTVGDDLGVSTPDSLVEVHRDSGSTAKPKRGFHSLGRITDTLNAVVAWAVAELELLGTNGISALHSALRVKLTNANNGTMTGGADLRAGDFEVVNGGGSSPIAKLTAVQAVVTNNSGAAATDAVGVKVTINNSGTIANPYAIHTDPGGIVHLGDTLELQRPAAVPGTPATDLIRVYPKTDGKLYAKNWSGQEYDLTTAADGTITAAKLADNAVTNAKLADGAVNTAELVDGAVTNAKLGNTAVGTTKIADDAVTLAKLAHGTTGKVIGFDATGAPAEITVDTTTGNAPSGATYITQTPHSGLSAEQALSSLATGLLKNTTGSGVLSVAAPGTDYLQPDGTTGDLKAADFPTLTGDVTTPGGSLATTLANNAVTNAKLANTAVGTTKIADDAVTLAKLAHGTANKYLGFDASGVPSELNAPSGGAGAASVLSNGSFEVWENGTATPPDNWVLTGSGAAVAREGTLVKHGNYSAKLTRSGADCHLSCDVYANGGKTFMRSRQYTFGAWVYATAANRVRLRVNDGTTTTYSSYHTGDSTWQYLTATFTVGASATAVNVGLAVDTGDTSGYFDGATLAEGSSASSYQPEIQAFVQFPRRATLWHDEAITTVGTAIASAVNTSHLYNTVTRQPLATPANGDTFTHSFWLASGTYNFYVLGVSASDAGKLDWYVDNVLIGAGGQDWYSSGWVYNVIPTALSVTIVGNGYHVLKGVVNGKNASSSNYYIRLTKYWFSPTAD